MLIARGPSIVNQSSSSSSSSSSLLLFLLLRRSCRSLPSNHRQAFRLGLPATPLLPRSPSRLLQRSLLGISAGAVTGHLHCFPPRRGDCQSPHGALRRGAGGEEREGGEGEVEGADVGIASGEGVVKVGIRV